MSQGFADMRVELQEDNRRGLVAIRAELRENNERITSDLRDELRTDLRGFHRQIQENGTTFLNALQATNRNVNKIAVMVKKTWTDMYGSDYPPPDPPDDSTLDSTLSFPSRDKHRKDESGSDRIPIEQKVSGDFTMAGLQGQLISVDGRLGQLTADVVKNNEGVGSVREEVKTIAKLQREQLGKPDPDDTRSMIRRAFDGVAWLFKEREGQRFLLILVAAIGSLIGAFHGSSPSPPILP